MEIWDVNWPSLTAFLACSTQWRQVGGLTRLTFSGLDYPGVDIVLKRMGLGVDVFDDIQVMELAALGAFNEVD